MITISADELDLLTFFECEPKLRDADVRWVYNDALYEFSRGDLTLSCAIAPSYKDVRLILKNGLQAVYELNAMGLADVRYHKDSNRESLEIEISDHDRLWVRLKPAITISHEAKE
ncbi:hypothetical protein GPA19_23845 [Azoarcus indigens]|uniref:hypothetical protein n=1 Tax=Azoarcus indigens TaxID=29545 RepID=UPI00105B29AE|nr:hypothetical protein [Azoarcus indigens]NMG67979.1 hypothetical protein [Azoarcus indigens]